MHSTLPPSLPLYLPLSLPLLLPLLLLLSPSVSGSVLCELEKAFSLPKIDPPRRSRDWDTVELVVSWCQEDISWVTNTSLVSGFKTIFLYSKCNASLPFPVKKYPHIRLETLPNIGNCDHTYLHHILSHWFTLAAETVFYKGRLDEECPPSDLIRSGDSDSDKLVCCKGNDELTNKDNQFREGFKMRLYLTRNNPIVHEKFFRYRGNLGRFLTHLVGKDNAKQLFATGRDFCYGGYFSLPAHVIHRHSAAMYEALIFEQKHPREEVDHYIERLWTPLSRSAGIYCRDTKDDVSITPAWVEKILSGLTDFYVELGRRGLEREAEWRWRERKG
jgi:hypothetical protein